MKDDLIDLSLQFIAKNWIDISLALLGMFLIVSYIVVYNIQIEPKSHKRPGRIIMMETMKNRLHDPDFNKLLKKGFCDSHKNSHTLEKSCNQLSEKSCNTTHCCVYAHNGKTGKSKCVSGDGERGPIYKSDKEDNLFPYDYWYYLGKKVSVKN